MFHTPTRRELLQVGASSVLGLMATSSLRAAEKRSRPKSVVFVFLTGAASQLETFDPKPDAPAEIRGELGSIQTAVAGLRFGELLPKLAERAKDLAVVRTMAHANNNHTAATHHVLTGAIQPGVRFDKPLSRDDWPVFAAGANYLRPPVAGTPAGITLPFFLQDNGAGLVWPGQHAGFLGPRYDPWQINSDPNTREFKVDNLQFQGGLTADQLTDRMALLGRINDQQALLAESAEGLKLTDQQQKATALLTSGTVAKAFDLEKESPSVRDRYGRHTFGQSLLLARRLVQAGVPVIQANMGRVQNWDSHSDIFNRKKKLLPPLDQGVSALLDDLKDFGLLNDTLVIVAGEFGRTPKLSVQNPGAKIGRDHWAACFSAVFAGGGVRGGQIVGKSDARAAYPITPAFSPDDLGATVYKTLGIDPHTEVRDRLNRPVQLNRGTPMDVLFTG